MSLSTIPSQALSSDGKNPSKESSLTRQFHQLSAISKQSKQHISAGGSPKKQNNHYLKPRSPVGGPLI